LVVESCAPKHAVTRVVVPGALSNRKGASVIGAVLPLSALTDKDRRDLDFALNMGADWVALSFVQRPEDIKEVRDLVGGRANVMAKLEKPSVIDRRPRLSRSPTASWWLAAILGWKCGLSPCLWSSVVFFALAARRASPSSSPRRCWSR
jgi:hypothetical protein